MFLRFFISTGKEAKNSLFNWSGNGSYLYHFAKPTVRESDKKSYIANFPTASGSFKVSWIHIGPNSRESSVITLMNEETKRNRNHKGEPAYKRIQRAIRQRIESGELKPGDVVDSERELAKFHSVSLMTARHALADLAQEGAVERRHGAGTFVAPPQILFNKLLSLPARSRIVSSSIVNREHEIAARLGLSPTSRLVRIERVRSAGDEPVALEICYLSDEECHALLDAPLDRASLFATLERECGIELAYADEEVDATHADIRIARLLNILNGSPLLRIRQLIFSTKGRATIYMMGFYRSGRHTLKIRRFR
jgi:GntR family transcriptional regulator